MPLATFHYMDKEQYNMVIDFLNKIDWDRSRIRIYEDGESTAGKFFKVVDCQNTKVGLWLHEIPNQVHTITVAAYQKQTSLEVVYDRMDYSETVESVIPRVEQTEITSVGTAVEPFLTQNY